MLYERGVSEGLFFLLKTEAKIHKSGQIERNKGEKRRGICASFTAVIAAIHVLILPGHSWMDNLFSSFYLLHLSLRGRGLDMVSLIFLTHYIIGAKTSGYFPRGSVVLSFPLSEMTCA